MIKKHPKITQLAEWRRKRHEEEDNQTEVIYLSDPHTAAILGLFDIINAQNDAFDEALCGILERIAEKENVRSVIKTWRTKREEMNDLMEEYIIQLEEGESE